MNSSKHILIVFTGLILLALAPACEDDDDGGNLPEVDCVTVPTFGEVALFTSCTGCHSSTLQGGARNGAPQGVDYDNYAAAMANAERGARLVYAGTMPPGGGVLPEADKQAFYNWALCGTPQ